MVAFTYAQWLTHMVTVLENADPDGETAFNALAPSFIERGERPVFSDPELDFLSTATTDTTQLTTRGTRLVPIPTQLITVESFNLITPANTFPYAPGAMRIPYLRTTREFIDLIWPIESVVQPPNFFSTSYYAIFDMDNASEPPGEEPVSFPSSFIVAPTPDDAYRVEVTGTFRPPALSAATTESCLTTFYYPLFLAATLVAGYAYLRDYGQASEDPRAAVTWREEYERQKAMVVAESKRQKALMGGFSAEPHPMPVTGQVAQAIGVPPQAAAA